MITPRDTESSCLWNVLYFSLSNQTRRMGVCILCRCSGKRTLYSRARIRCSLSASIIPKTGGQPPQLSLHCTASSFAAPYSFIFMSMRLIVGDVLYIMRDPSQSVLWQPPRCEAGQLWMWPFVAYYITQTWNRRRWHLSDIKDITV